MERIKTALALGLTLIPPFFATPASSAYIRCEDSYQLVNGSWIATPYCEDEYLASVATAYGEFVSPPEIRNNPGTKEEVCRLVGNDIRVNDICSPYFDSGRRGGGD